MIRVIWDRCGFERCRLSYRRDSTAILRDNRKEGHRLEQWAAHFLRRLHHKVLVVGGIHGGAVQDSYAIVGAGVDIIADGLYYEVKSCRETIRRATVKSGVQLGSLEDRHDLPQRPGCGSSRAHDVLLLVKCGRFRLREFELTQK